MHTIHYYTYNKVSLMPNNTYGDLEFHIIDWSKQLVHSICLRFLLPSTQRRGSSRAMQVRGKSTQVGNDQHTVLCHLLHVDVLS